MQSRKRPSSRQAIDVINPDAFYSKNGLRRIGIGAVQEMEAKKKGALKTYKPANRVWFLGSDIIELIKSKGGNNGS